MKQLRDIVAAATSDRSFVLGTVVDVRGSSYRKPGARVLIGEDGSRVGLISGGCLEKDVVRNAFAWTAEGPEVVLFDTRGDRLNPQGDYGTGCDGLVWLMLERWPGGADIDPLAEIATTWETGEPAVLATVCAVRDGDEVIGARALQRGEETTWSRGVSERVRSALGPHLDAASDWSRPSTIELNFGDSAVSVLVEPLRPPPELLVYGAGDDTQPLARIATEMGWDVRVADRWPALVTRDRFPDAAELVCEPMERLASHAAPGRGSHVVLMTHNLSDDATLLPELLDSEASWIGLLGPRRRTARLIQMLAERGQLPPPESIDRVQTPVGLDLGGDAPEEVALSIIAAITAHRHDRDGGLLQQTERSIHPAHRTVVEEVE